MLSSDYIRVYEQVLPVALCDQIIDRFEQHHRDAPDWRLELPTESGESHAVRSCQEINFNRNREIWGDLEAQLLHYVKLGVQKYVYDCPGCQFPEKFGYEAVRIKKYTPSRGDHFAPHIDSATLESCKRYLACFFFLNDVHEGGETCFPHYHLELKPQKGRMFLFPPFWMYVHAGKAPISNPKYLVGTYLHHVEGGDKLLAIPEKEEHLLVEL
jgi:hypothetical protein